MRRNGFTVVEVVIVTLFLTLVIWGGRAGYAWYVHSSRADTAEELVTQLQQAQHRFFQTHGRYLALSESESGAVPSAIPEEGARFGPETADFFSQLGVTPPSEEVFFRIAVLAGAEQPLPANGWLSEEQKLSFPLNTWSAPQPWFYIVAFADQDGDGKNALIEAASWAPEIVQTDRTE